MRLMGRVGDNGNDTFAIGAGRKDYHAKSKGELFFYVNGMVFGWLPGRWWARPYTWKWGFNEGTAPITVSSIDE